MKKIKLNFGRTKSWSELPQELLKSIAARLSCRNQVCHFRAVCKHWRRSVDFSALPVKPLLNPLLPHHLTEFRFPSRFTDYIISDEPLVLVASSVVLLRPASDLTQRPWLVTVEERNPGKLYVRHPLSTAAVKCLPDDFPKVLDLSRFNVFELFKGYLFRGRDTPRKMFQKMRWRDTVINKVLFVSCGTGSEFNSTIVDACHAYVLHHNGCLVSIYLSKNYYLDAEYDEHLVAPSNKKIRFDDAVVFKGKVYVIDRKGRTYYVISGRLERIISDRISDGSWSDWRKHLVESDGHLYLVYRFNESEKMKFKIYEFDEEGPRWVEIKGVGKTRILFVTEDGCFFASSRDLGGWRGNCVVFSRGSFTSYDCHAESPDFKFIKWKDCNLDVAVYYFEDQCNPYQIERHMSYSKLFWPPPAWLSPDTCSKDWGSDEDEHKVSNLKEAEHSLFDLEYGFGMSVKEEGEQEHAYEDPLNCKDERVSEEDEHDNSESEEDERVSEEDEHDNSESEEDEHYKSDSEINDQEHAHEDALNYEDDESLEEDEDDTSISEEDGRDMEAVKEVSEELIVDQTHNNIASKASIGFVTQCSKVAAVREKLKGLDLKPDLVPTLQKVLVKHGDIIDGSRTRTAGTKAAGLELVAEIVQILQSSTGRSLNDGQSEFLSSALSDLQLLHFKVDWLEPSVEEALGVTEKKSLINSLTEVEKDISQAEEKKVRLLDELAKVDERAKGLEKKRILLTEKISVTGPVDLDQYLGDGLC